MLLIEFVINLYYSYLLIFKKKNVYVHFYYFSCFQAFSESDDDCPACTPNNKQIMDIIRTQVSFIRNR